MRFTAKSLAIVCAFLMDGLPPVVKWPPWPHSTHVHWQDPSEGRGDPQRTEVTSQYERAGALKRMDSISGPITFSLTHFQGDLQPCTDQAKAKGQGSD